MLQRTVIQPRNGRQLVDWQELYRYRDLFYFLIQRDIKILYTRTVLGFSWAILQPLFSMVIFTAIFGNLAKLPSDDLPYAVFSYAGLVPWTYFSSALTVASMSLGNNSSMLTKVYFPRLIIPFTPIFAKLVDFTIAFCILLLMMLYYGIWPTWNVLMLPWLLLIMVVTASGIGALLSALSMQYRDVRFALSFFLQLLMYAAPVVWPASLIPTSYRWLYGLYPMAGVIEGFRASLLNSTPMPWDLILSGSVSAIGLFIGGIAYFRHMERIYADLA